MHGSHEQRSRHSRRSGRGRSRAGPDSTSDKPLQGISRDLESLKRDNALTLPNLQQGEEEILGRDAVSPAASRLLPSALQDLSRARGQRNRLRLCHRLWARSHPVGDLRADGGHAQSPRIAPTNATQVRLAKYPDENRLAADVTETTIVRLDARQLDCLHRVLIEPV